MLEEYGAKFVHMKGEENVVTDTLSRHPNLDPDDDDDVSGPLGKVLSYYIARILTLEEDDETQYSYANLVDEEDINDAGICALSPKVMAQYQQKDRDLLKKVSRKQANYGTVELEDEVLIAHNGKVMVPEALQDRLIDQYHLLLNHPGMTRMEATLDMFLTSVDYARK